MPTLTLLGTVHHKRDTANRVMAVL